MNGIKVSELFYSLQGEGRYVGTPSVFLRTFGCNLRCPGFGRDHSVAHEPNTDVQKLIEQIPVFKEKGFMYRDLPLSPTGCDTYAAVYPEFKDFSPVVPIDELAQRCKDLTPDGFSHDVHLVITGGEPLLPGWQKKYPDLVRALEYVPFITFETNGTQNAGKHLHELMDYSELHFSVSPKLQASGVPKEDALNIDAICSLFELGIVDFKFVVANESDVAQVRKVLREDLGFAYTNFSMGAVYLMPVGGTYEEYKWNEKLVAELALEEGYRFSPRLQCDLWNNEWGT